MEPIYIALICSGGALICALIALFIYLSNNLLQVTRYTLKSDKVRAEGVTVVHLSDLHGKSFGKGNKRLIAAVKKQSPDFIAFTGDAIHKYREKDISVALALVGKLKDIAPVLYVSGNHEMRSKAYANFRDQLREAGATVLDGGYQKICNLTVCGVNCARIKGNGFFNLAEDDGSYKILLTHYPHYIARYASAGYDLTLCGHAHGGQWRIPFTGVGVYAPGQGLFPKYTAGVHSCGDMRQVISRGLGNSECPVRLFNRPQLVVVKLERE